ncbi:hypothetical protein HYS79_01440 [Patescibacteria group bacterium]|nr:hypothetical protein [Patescibacteria group bacterium]
MKYFVTGISILLSLHPLFALAFAGGGGLALTTYSSSEVSTGGIQVGGSGSAYSESGSASVEIKNTLNTNAGSGVVEVEVQTEAGGVVHKESVIKTISPSDKSVQVFVATSSGAGVSARAGVWQDFYFFTYSLPGNVSHWFSNFFSFFGSR